MSLKIANVRLHQKWTCATMHIQCQLKHSKLYDTGIMILKDHHRPCRTRRDLDKNVISKNRIKQHKDFGVISAKNDGYWWCSTSTTSWYGQLVEASVERCRSEGIDPFDGIGIDLVEIFIQMARPFADRLHPCSKMSTGLFVQ